MPWMILVVCVALFFSCPAQAQPDDDGGPGGGGPGDPPRTTPGLTPTILTGIAASGYWGVQALKNRNRSLKK